PKLLQLVEHPLRLREAEEVRRARPKQVGGLGLDRLCDFVVGHGWREGYHPGGDLVEREHDMSRRQSGAQANSRWGQGHAQLAKDAVSQPDDARTNARALLTVLRPPILDDGLRDSILGEL